MAFNCSVLFTMTVDYPYCSIQDFLRYKKKTESSINQWHYFSNAEVVNTAYGKKVIIYEHRIIWKGTAEATASTFNGTEVQKLWIASTIDKIKTRYILRSLEEDILGTATGISLATLTKLEMFN